MNRHEFISELKGKLRKLPYDEITEAIDYYEGYFDDAGEENEQATLEELGSPSAIAAQIIANFAVKEASAEKPRNKSWQSTWLVILALFASPIALPLILAAGAVALALIISLSAVLLSFIASGVAIVVAGLASVIAGILVIAQSFPTTLLCLGVGLLLLGVGAAIAMATTLLSKKCYGWLTKRIGGFILRRKAT